MPQTSVPLIETVRLSKHYKIGASEVAALTDVSVSICSGAFVAIMGRSGSGKSTLMNQLGCLDTPTSGTYRFGGEDVSMLTPDELAQFRNRWIGFCFQSFNLLPRATALANVELPLIYRGVEPAERRQRAKEVLNTVGLADRLDHLPSQLSGGQQQRVAIARALVTEPRLILADEPTGTLDERTGLEIMALFQQLNASGITLIVVTHEPEIARFADRVLMLRDGRLASDTATGPAVMAQTLLGLALDEVTA